MKRISFVALLTSLIVAAAGCVGVPVAPKTEGPPPKGPAVDPEPVGPAAYGIGRAGWRGPPPTPVGPLPNGPGGPPPYQGGVSEQAALFMQRLASLEDDKKIMASRVAQLEGQLREKDRALAQAAFELQDATAQVSRTREDLERWKSEMDKLRAKLRTMEKDSKVTLETIIRTLEQYLDRNPEARRPAEILELLPPPRMEKE